MASEVDDGTDSVCCCCWMPLMLASTPTLIFFNSLSLLCKSLSVPPPSPICLVVCLLAKHSAANDTHTVPWLKSGLTKSRPHDRMHSPGTTTARSVRSCCTTANNNSNLLLMFFPVSVNFKLLATLLLSYIPVT